MVLSNTKTIRSTNQLVFNKTGNEITATIKSGKQQNRTRRVTDFVWLPFSPSADFALVSLFLKEELKDKPTKGRGGVRGRSPRSQEG